MPLDATENFGTALRVIDDVWSVLRANNAWDPGDEVPSRLTDIGVAAMTERAKLGRQLLDRMSAINVAALPLDLPSTLEVARRIAERWTREEDWYWLLFDPLGVGFYGMFAPTAYCGGFLLNSFARIFREFRFDSQGDGDRFVGLVRDYGRVVRQMFDRTKGQAERGIYMPQAQLAQAIPLMQRFRSTAEGVLVPDRSRLNAVDADNVVANATSAVAQDVLPAFDELIGLLKSDEYASAAPETVGLSQYPGGAEAYRTLVRLHTTLDLSPEQVHDMGLSRIADIKAQMRKLLDGQGFAGSPVEYLEEINGNPKWRASGAEEVGAVFQKYIDRIAAHLDENFNLKPKANHGVAPLPESLTQSMTFGFYSPPAGEQQVGLYLFNTPNLSNGPLNHIGALNYHELVPGHHFHLATQRENESLHPLRRRTFINAFNEGWAEYAATLAGEMGMYPTAEEKFGRLMMDSFLTCRLVVDTGMNELGWSLERARDYMRENAFMPETEILSESVRYSCDIPGQALAYKLGDTVLLEAREKMRSALGNRFDIRDFHDAVLKPGALPLPLVKQNVDALSERLALQ